jgi:hypothetical protein
MADCQGQCELDCDGHGGRVNPCGICPHRPAPGPSPEERQHDFPRLTRREVIERLDRLVEHGFVTRWWRNGAQWYAEASTIWGPYTLREMAAWVEGANAMGAAS